LLRRECVSRAFSTPQTPQSHKSESTYGTVFFTYIAPIPRLTFVSCLQVRSPDQLFGGAREALESDVRALNDKVSALEGKIAEAATSKSNTLAQLESRVLEAEKAREASEQERRSRMEEVMSSEERREQADRERGAADGERDRTLKAVLDQVMPPEPSPNPKP
jgi:hypothetical protein